MNVLITEPFFQPSPGLDGWLLLCNLQDEWNKHVPLSFHHLQPLLDKQGTEANSHRFTVTFVKHWTFLFGHPFLSTTFRLWNVMLADAFPSLLIYKTSNSVFHTLTNFLSVRAFGLWPSFRVVILKKIFQWRLNIK